LIRPSDRHSSQNWSRNPRRIQFTCAQSASPQIRNLKVSLLFISLGIKKIVKREKPKLFRKKIIEECEVYVYNLGQTEISDIEFGI
jgi:hypothetical protein